MVEIGLPDIYRNYIACLNGQDWPRLSQFVHDEVRRNGKPFGLANYRAMLKRDFDEIPDLRFDVRLLVAEPPYVASRLVFDLQAERSLPWPARQWPAGHLRRERLL